VALIGFPSVGKSTLLSTITKTKSEAASYEFTTLTCVPGVIEYKGEFPPAFIEYPRTKYSFSNVTLSFSLVMQVLRSSFSISLVSLKVPPPARDAVNRLLQWHELPTWC